MADSGRRVKLDAGLSEEIRQLYVQGVDTDGVRSYPSIDQLSQEHGVSKATLFRRASDQGWKDQRSIFETQLAAELDAQRRNELVKEAGEFDKNNIRLAQALQSQIGGVVRHNIESRQTNPRLGPLSPDALTQLAQALVTVQRIGRLALGDSTEITKVDATINNNAIEEAYKFLDELTDAKRGSEPIVH